MSVRTERRHCTRAVIGLAGMIVISLLGQRLAAQAVAAPAADAADVYVAAAGAGDNHDGSVMRPVATLPRALALVRDRRAAAPDRRGPWVIMLRGGDYYLPEPVAITPEDSGTADAPLLICAYPGEEPRLSGGRRIEGWSVLPNGHWQVVLPEVRDGSWRFSQLFVNGQRRLRPRVPKEHYSFIAQARENDRDGARPGHNRFQYRPGDVSGAWYRLEDVDALIFHNWSMSRIPVASVDESERVVSLVGHTWNPRMAELAPGINYLMENVREALDEPGEWYLDRGTGQLSYIPMPGERPADSVVIAPQHDKIISLVGEAGGARPVVHVTLRGLTMMHTNWNVPADGYSSPQADISNHSTQGQSPFSATLPTRWAEDCHIEQCRIAHTGYYAVEFGIGTARCSLRDCEMWDLGGGGVIMGTTQRYGIDDPRCAKANAVEDCLIAHGGRLHPAACAVWIGHSPDNSLQHNDIHDFYYTGISVGWSWSYGPSSAKRNQVSYNHIWDIGQRRLSDLGGIYTLGASEGTMLSHNLIHDVSRVHYGGSGIYFDQGSSGITVENNIVYHTQDAGFNVHWAKDNVIRNNIFALADNAQINPGRMDKSGAMSFTNNIVLWSQGRLIGSKQYRDDFVFQNNILWCDDPEPIALSDGTDFSTWQDAHLDDESRFVNPRFADPARGDFSLPPDSPALAMGFKAIDQAAIGRRTPRRLPTQYPPVPHCYSEEGTAPPIEFVEDFEHVTPGTIAPLMSIYQNDDKETAVVTDGVGVNGSRAIVVTDGPAPGPAFNPHFHYSLNAEYGRMETAFAINFRDRVPMYLAWRNGSAAGFKTGPTFLIDKAGCLRVADRELLTVPLNSWLRISIVSALGDKSDGSFQLTVAIDGGEPVVFKDLPCRQLSKELKWLGWVADGTDHGVFVVDDISVRPQPEE